MEEDRGKYACWLLSIVTIVTDTKENTEVIGPMFLPKHEITDKERATGSNDCSISSNVPEGRTTKRTCYYRQLSLSR
jgi:hypothetical protein